MILRPILKLLLIKKAASLKTWIEKNEVLMLLLFLITLGGFIAPYTSNSKVYLEWLLNLQIQSEDQFTIFTNPLWVTLLVFLIWFRYLLEFLFPNIFGANNIFLLRFLLKFPLLLAYSISFFIFLKYLSKKYVKLNLKQIFFFSFSWQLPILYLVFIWGSPIILAWLFWVVFLNEIAKDNHSNFRAGFYVGLCLSFAYIYIFLIITRIRGIISSKAASLNQVKAFFLGIGISWALILFPYVIWSGSIIFIDQTGKLGSGAFYKLVIETTGLSLDLLFFSFLSTLACLFLCMIVFFHYISMKKNSWGKIYVFYVLNLLLFYPLLRIEETVLLFLDLFPYITYFIAKRKNFLKDTKSFPLIFSKKQQTFFYLCFLGSFLVHLSLVLVLFFALPTNEVFHVDFIRLFFLGTVNQSLTSFSRDFLLLFLYYAPLIWYSILIFCIFALKPYTNDKREITLVI